MNRNYITKDGVEKLKLELENLSVKLLPEAVAALSIARAFGDLSENAEYVAAKNRCSAINRRIVAINEILASSKIVNVINNGEEARFGTIVTIMDLSTNMEKSYTLVGRAEANIENNAISIESPMGRELVGKKLGDIIEIQSRNGLKAYKITKIS